MVVVGGNWPHCDGRGDLVVAEVPGGQRASWWPDGVVVVGSGGGYEGPDHWASTGSVAVHDGLGRVR